MVGIEEVERTFPDLSQSSYNSRLDSVSDLWLPQKQFYTMHRLDLVMEKYSCCRLVSQNDKYCHVAHHILEEHPKGKSSTLKLKGPADKD